MVFILSALGVLLVMGLARVMGFAADPVLDEAQARRRAADALAGFRPQACALAGDGRAALVQGDDGAIALVRPLGDRWVVRRLDGAAVSAGDGALLIRPAEPMFPPTRLALGAAAADWARRLGAGA
jgi:hypothetical protein